MRTKLTYTVGFFITMLIIFGACVYFMFDESHSDDLKREQMVALNEINQLTKKAASENAGETLFALEEKIEDLQLSIKGDTNADQKNTLKYAILAVCGFGVVFLVGVFGYIYFAILRPFEQMKNYAEKIASGDFDVPLNYARSNYFGAFTWAFDHMRLEIIKARTSENEAIENNKTVIATLSHDIKTPISSIRAYAEGLEANLDKSAEKRAKYLKIIMGKCDEVAKLADDLFLHALSDLNKLKIDSEEVELGALLSEIMADLSVNHNDIHFVKPECVFKANIDKKRFVQVLENLVNNARKYAKSHMDISIELENNFGYIIFRDYGKGIPDADLPFIFDKFYRGSNCLDEEGSGLGLYIVNHIMAQMGGSVSLRNLSDGLEVKLMLAINKA